VFGIFEIVTLQAKLFPYKSRQPRRLTRRRNNRVGDSHLKKIGVVNMIRIPMGYQGPVLWA